MLGATIEPLRIDGRLFEWIDVELKNLRTCGKMDQLVYYIFDLFPLPPRPDQVVTVRPGYWYGEEVNFLLFDKREKETGPGPDCFEAELVVGAVDGRVAAKLPIRVVRTDKPPAAPAGGTEEPKPPPSDAGAP